MRQNNAVHYRGIFIAVLGVVAYKFKYIRVNNLAVTCMRRKEYTRAYDLLKKAVSIDPRYAKALSNMSITCFYLSKFYEAYGYYLQARNADRAYIDERFERTRVIERIERMQRENPGNDDYRRMLERLRSQDKALQ